MDPMGGRTEEQGYVAHRGLRRIAKRLGVSKNTVGRWHASWELPLYVLPIPHPPGFMYVLAEALAQEWERRRAEEIQQELRNGLRPNPLRYRRGRCPHCKVILQRLATDRMAARQKRTE